jgi:tRNA-dihydrouridine synthase 3
MKNEGIAPIKDEFKVAVPPVIPTTDEAIQEVAAEQVIAVADEPETEKGKKRTFQERGKKKKTGPAPRKFFQLVEKVGLCNQFMRGRCSRDVCRYGHDLKSYLAAKNPDLPGPCPNEERHSECRFRAKCRHRSAHTKTLDILVNQEKDEELETYVTNIKNMSVYELRVKVRKKQLLLPKSAKVMEALKADEETKTAFFKVRPEEKKRMVWKDKLYLAPLTTTGNLPFRRMCKKFGADITCSEMALGHTFLQSNSSEWALLKRDPTEDVFGVQICGQNTQVMSQVAEILTSQESGLSIDFLDINFGCPIDMVWDLGAGACLLDRPNRLLDIVAAVDYCSLIPVTCKIRTGILSGKPTAHKLLPRLANGGHVQLVTMHGRSREQRYTKLSDWDYIKQCGKEFDRSKMSFFGNGDILGWEDYYRDLETGVDGCMIARGALIKPWIFTEIKEKRTWDISSSERFDMLCDFAKAGVEVLFIKR